MMTPAPGHRILLAEDDAILRAMTADLLELNGYQVTMASGGAQAIESFGQACPDLVLADISMAEGDGYSLLKHIRGHQTASDVPVIFLSGKSGLADIRAGLRVGVDDYIPKPFDPDELLRSISLRISRREQKQRLDALLGRSLHHDFRTPLTGILGFAELLRAAAMQGTPIPAAEVSEAAEMMQYSAERLLELIEKVGTIVEITSSSPKLAETYRTVTTTDWLAGARRNCEAVAQKMDRTPDLVLLLEEVPVPVPMTHWLMTLAQLLETAFEGSAKGIPVRVTGRREGQAYHVSVDCTVGASAPARVPVVHPGTSVLPVLGPGMDLVRRVAALASADLQILPTAGGTVFHLTLPEAPRK
jgi:DNA-binding response OmpR family regulator